MSVDYGVLEWGREGEGSNLGEVEIRQVSGRDVKIIRTN